MYITEQQAQALIASAQTEREAKLITALIYITRQGGNQPDDALMERTGPNDAVARGIMYVNAREIALNALGVQIAEPV